MTKRDPRATYEAGRTARRAEAAAEDRRSRAIGTARLVVALGIIALFVGIAWLHFVRAAGLGIMALVVLFAALVVVHARIEAKKDRAEAAARFHERGLARLGGKWKDFASTGERFLTDDHAYADDLDLFGRASLFQLLDATETRFGEETLAAWLGSAAGKSDLEKIRARQVAVKELAALVTFREKLSALGALASEGKPDPAPFLKWAEGDTPLGLPGVVRVVATLVSLAVIAGMTLASATSAPSIVWLAPALVALAVLGATSSKVSPVVARASAREIAFGRYADMIELVEAQKFESEPLKALHAKMSASGASATKEMRRLRTILAWVDARNNEVWRFFIGPILLWDLQCAFALEGWRHRAGKVLRGWIEAIGEAEALASFAGLAFDRPDHVWPVLGEEPKLVASGLGHPMIDASARVANDVSFAGPGSALVVTGSNMSGKSTLLRAVGVNAVLALAGAPVCAERLEIGPLVVTTSMRVRDSLSDGVSRFYAEVKKIKRVIDRAREPGITALYLLDEVLHGTNSRERLIGARAIVQDLVKHGAIGAVSTHDLALGDLEERLPGKVVNVHLEEQVAGNEMTFDYKLRPGVVHSSNALRLMRLVGIDVVDVE